MQYANSRQEDFSATERQGPAHFNFGLASFLAVNSTNDEAGSVNAKRFGCTLVLLSARIVFFEILIDSDFKKLPRSMVMII